jgi:hypothetical protein
MPNRKVLQAAKERRRGKAVQAGRVYRRYAGRVPELIAKLGGPTQQGHDLAFDLLGQMNVLIVPELLAALSDQNLDPFALDEVVSLLGTSGDERAIQPLWEHFMQVSGDPDRASSVALSLSALGEERVLPYLRAELDSGSPERVSNAVAALVTIGEIDDVNRLRAVHYRYRGGGETAQEIRMGAANAILAILGETDPNTLEKTLDQIRSSFPDRALWEDIWSLLENSFGPGA